MKIQGGREIEVKLRIADPGTLLGRLRRLRASRLGRVYEMNTLFDTPSRRLSRMGRLLRLRRTVDSRSGRVAARLTWKGPSARGAGYKVRRELELEVVDAVCMAAVLQGIGLRPAFRYEKRRTTYQLPQAPGLLLELDETPIGFFVELEGSPRRIDRAARLLGYGRADYLTSSYLALYLRERRRQGLPPGDMLFTSRKKSRSDAVFA